MGGDYMGDISIQVPENYLKCPECLGGGKPDGRLVPIVANEELKWKCVQCGKTVEAEGAIAPSTD